MHKAQNGRVGPLPPHMCRMRARSAGGVCTPLALYAFWRAGSFRAMGVLARAVLAHGPPHPVFGGPSSPSLRSPEARSDLRLGLRPQPGWSLRRACMNASLYHYINYILYTCILRVSSMLVVKMSVANMRVANKFRANLLVAHMRRLVTSRRRWRQEAP